MSFFITVCQCQIIIRIKQINFLFIHYLIIESAKHTKRQVHMLKLISNSTRKIKR